MRKLVLAVVAALSLCLLAAQPAQARPVQAAADPTWWQPAVGSTLHWVLEGAIDVNNPKQVGERELGTNAVLPRPNVLDIDGEYNTAATVATLHARGQKVICYIDAGVYENYRSDASKFPKSVVGSKDGQWAGSYWLDIRRLDILLPIMEARIVDWCKSKGFDAVEPDEIDGWENTSGFPLTYAQQLTYNRAIADLAHKHGLGIVQKGDIIQSQDLHPWFDGVLNEECSRYRECSNPYREDTDTEQLGLQVYSDTGKVVWIAEYRAGDCTRAKAYLKQYPTWRAWQFREGLPLNAGRKAC